MRAYLIASAAAALGLATAAAAQPGPPGQRIIGTVASVSPTELVITTASGSVQVGLSPETRVMKRQDARPDDITAGAYLGTANQTNADGSGGTSTEVHLMDNGPNVNAPMNNAGLVMTNGHVKAVKATRAGREIDIDYGQGTTRHVVVPEGTPTAKISNVGASGLAVGENVTAMAQPGADQKTAAMAVIIEPPGAH